MRTSMRPTTAWTTTRATCTSPEHALRARNLCHTLFILSHTSHRLKCVLESHFIPIVIHDRFSLSRFSSSTSTCPSLSSSFPATSCTASCTLSTTTWSPWKSCATPLKRGVTTPTTSRPPSHHEGPIPRTEKIGDLITADRKVMNEECESRNNHRNAVVVQDLATQLIQSFQSKTKTSQETEKTLRRFLEPTEKPKVIHTDKLVVMTPAHPPDRTTFYYCCWVEASHPIAPTSTVHDPQNFTELGGREVFQNTCWINRSWSKWQQQERLHAVTTLPPHQNTSLWLFTPLRSVHHDTSLEFGKSCEDLIWNHRTSTPHRSETNGIAERAVRRVKEGTSAVLLPSGLHERWGSDSMECHCYLRNVQDLLADGKTPYEKDSESH